MSTNNKGFNADYEEETATFQQISELQGNTVLEFGAPWCAHCQAAMLAVKEVLTEHTELSHIKVYDGKGKQLGRSFKVKLWPTLILLRNGHEIGRIVRPLNTSQIRQFVSNSH